VLCAYRDEEKIFPKKNNAKNIIPFFISLPPMIKTPFLLLQETGFYSLQAIYPLLRLGLNVIEGQLSLFYSHG
jgi:hypothetical protein